MNSIFFENKLSSYDMTSFTIVDNKIYFSDNYVNGIYSINIDTNEISLVSHIIGEKQLQEILYYGVICASNKLFFSPAFAEEITVIDLETERVQKIAFETREREYDINKPKFFAMCEYRENIIMVGDYYPGILFIDKKELTTTCFDYLKYLHGFINEEKERLVIRNARINNNWLYLPCGKKNIVIAIDLENKEVHELLINEIETDEGVADIIWFDGATWLLTSKQGLVIKAKVFKAQVSIEHIYYNSKSYIGYDVGRFCVWNDNLMVFPLLSKDIYLLDQETNKFVVWREIHNSTKRMGNRFLQTIPCLYTEYTKLAYLDGSTMEIVVVDTDGNTKRLNLARGIEKTMIEMYISDIVNEL